MSLRFSSLRKTFKVLLVGMVTALALTVLSPATEALASPTDTLVAGSQLGAGQSISSLDGRYTLVMQSDGNLVVYGPTGAIWNTATATGNGSVTAMQSDGNLVVYRSGGVAVWSSNTAPSGGNRLVMQSDGNLVIYSGGGPALWSSNGGLTGNNSGSTTQVSDFRSWALSPSNWNAKTPAGNPGIDADGYFGAQCAEVGIAWSERVGHRVSFDGLDTSAASKAGWHYVAGNLGSAKPGDVITRVGGQQHVVVVTGSPNAGQIAVLEQNPLSPREVTMSTSTSGVIWRLN